LRSSLREVMPTNSLLSTMRCARGRGRIAIHLPRDQLQAAEADQSHFAAAGYEHVARDNVTVTGADNRVTTAPKRQAAAQQAAAFRALGCFMRATWVRIVGRTPGLARPRLVAWCADDVHFDVECCARLL
jgi:hypothetical protein